MALNGLLRYVSQHTRMYGAGFPLGDAQCLARLQWRIFFRIRELWRKRWNAWNRVRVSLRRQSSGDLEVWVHLSLPVLSVEWTFRVVPTVSQIVVVGASVLLDGGPCCQCKESAESLGRTLLGRNLALPAASGCPRDASHGQ